MDILGFDRVTPSAALAPAGDGRFAATGARPAIPEVDPGIPLAWGGVGRPLREAGPESPAVAARCLDDLHDRSGR